MQLAFVTGGSGFIGSELIRQLTAKGIRVRALLRKTSSRANLEGVEFEAVEGDLDNFEALRRGVDGASYVYHLAGVVSAKHPSDFFGPNALGSENLARACAEVNAKTKGKKISRLVYVSSLAASGPAESANPRVETDSENPISAYGRSKLEGEKRVLKYSDQVPVTIVRPPAVYGPRDKGIFEFIKMVNAGWIPVLPSKDPSGEKFMSLIYVYDLVRGILTAGLNGSQGNREVFFLSDGKTYSWSEIMNAMVKSLGRKKARRVKLPTMLLQTAAAAGSVAGRVLNKSIPLNLDKLRELQCDYWICSNESARRKLGFDAEFSLTDGLDKTIQWYRENHWL